MIVNVICASLGVRRTGEFYPAAPAVTLRPMPDLPEQLEEILAAVAGGALSPSAAAGRLRSGEVRYLDEFAVLDLGRGARKGAPEVVYARGKSPEQVARICETLLASRERVVVSAPSAEVLAELRRSLPHTPVTEAGRSVVLGSGEPAPSGGRVGAISAGTSDLPVLEEAVAVAREMGAAVRSFHDVGVAGIHRLAAPLEELRAFDPDCLIVAAGMEGALPSVVAGLVAVPVVGLPTSTGYGLGGDGTAAILGMLQTCSPGLSVVNVDNGVGAGATAALMANRAALGRASEPGPNGAEPSPG
jgi:pyridinium-3,5-biscarboxylic acid mononucleotide synthase